MSSTVPSFCPVCGAEMPVAAAFCPGCGAARYPLVAKASASPGWLIGGILLPPLWNRPVWLQAWPREVKLGASTLFVVAPPIVDLTVFSVGWTAAFAITILNIVVTILVVSSTRQRQKPAQDLSEFRQAIEEKFHLCHERILNLEHTVDVDRLPIAFKEEYVRALDRRSEAATHFEQAISWQQLRTVDGEVSTALDELDRAGRLLRTDEERPPTPA